jgi:ATP-dependent Zn protease
VIDREIAAILGAERERAEALLREHRPLLTALAETLLERKVLERADLRGVLGASDTSEESSDG